MASKRKTTVLCMSTIKSIAIEKLKGLHNATIEFDKPLTAIMGVNGVGKSTVLHALACAFQPDGSGDDYRFPAFFPPNTDSTWKDSKFCIEMEVHMKDGQSEKVTKTYEKQFDRWTRYNNRPKRNVYYIGISTCVPDIEKDKPKGAIHYTSKIKDDKISERVIKEAAYILNKDYKALTENKSTKRSYLGLLTNSELKYSSLSMGTGEQRTIRILQVAYAAEPYALLLIDEIDLLMHVSSLKRLIECLSKIAISKNLQIIFTTHSLVMESMMDYLDIRYLENITLLDKTEKTLVYPNISQELVYNLTGESVQPIHIYVEDELARGIVKSVVSKMNMTSKTDILTYGAATNAFTLASGIVLKKEDTTNSLIVLDGDCYISNAERLKQIEKTISGTEKDIDEKRKAALDIITMLNLPDNTAPEKFLYDCLLKCGIDEENEIIKAALYIRAVNDSHKWIGDICKKVNESEEYVVRKIVDMVSQTDEWSNYVLSVQKWLESRVNL